MRHLVISLTLALGAALSGGASAHDLPNCTRSGVEGLRHVDSEELEAHGGQVVGQTTAAFGALKYFDFFVDYVIDKNGRIACLSAVNIDETPLTPTPERRAFIDALVGTSFTPFLSEGRPAQVLAGTYVREDERPKYHVMPPKGDLAVAVIRLENHGRRSGDGPFTVVIRGDGTVLYTPSRFDDGYWYGPQTYHIAPEQVAAILALAEKADYWSLRETYYYTPFPNAKHPAPAGPDAYYNRVAITYGGRIKDLRIFDWGNSRGGASEAATHLMADMAVLARVELWHKFDSDTVAQLALDGFDFKSPSNCDRLLKMTRGWILSDEVRRDLKDRGVPDRCISPILSSPDDLTPEPSATKLP